MTFQHGFSVGGGALGEGCRPYLLAEMACSHEGEIDRARRLIDAAASAGVDAIQLQLFRREHQVPPSHKIYELLGKLELSETEWAAAFAHARAASLTVFVFVYDEPSLDLALELGADALKISSADLGNPELLDGAGGSGLPLTLGTGGSTLDEVAWGLDRVDKAGAERVVLMHGMQNFPTAVRDANINRLALLRRTFGLPVGYQDHTAGGSELAQVIDLVALGAGASVIEKHITLDRTEGGTDHQAALEPAELKRFATLIRSASEALGPTSPKPLGAADATYRAFQKRTVAAACDLAQGTVLERQHIRLLRQGSELGLPPKSLDTLLGKSLRRPLEAYAPIRADDLES